MAEEGVGGGEGRWESISSGEKRVSQDMRLW